MNSSISILRVLRGNQSPNKLVFMFGFMGNFFSSIGRVEKNTGGVEENTAACSAALLKSMS